jgi:hypothetical protein
MMTKTETRLISQKPPENEEKIVDFRRNTKWTNSKKMKKNPAKKQGISVTG